MIPSCSRWTRWQCCRNKSTISRHVKDAFESGELIPDSTVAFFATVQIEGGRKVSRDLAYYNLDMIISVGYRVHSLRGVQFRMWATRTLKEYLIKGFAMNDELRHRPVCQEGMKASTRGRKNIDFAKYFCFYQKSCIFASLELAEPLNNA